MIPSGCICKKNFFLKNGNCVLKTSCELQSWSDWSGWTECSDPCLEGSEGTKSYGFSNSPIKILSLLLKLTLTRPIGLSLHTPVAQKIADHADSSLIRQK